MTTPAPTAPTVDPRTDDEPEVTEPDGYAHYVKIKALMVGGPVTALCGKRYVPTTIGGAGDKDVCPKCAEMMAFLHAMDA